MHRQSPRGFTLVEVAVVVAVLAILAMMALPVLGDRSDDDARVTALLDRADELREACRRFHADTGHFAVEHSDADVDAGHRRLLSHPQPLTGWDGPYLRAPLSTADSPFTSFVHLHDDLDVNRNGFDLDGDGELETRGAGQVALFGNVGEAAARQIDAALDAGVPGAWAQCGRVQWRRGVAYLFLLQE